MLASKENRAIALVVGYKKISVVCLSIVLLNRIRPHEITNRPFERHFIDPVEFLQLLNGFSKRSDASMHAEVILIDDADQRQGVEGVHDVEIHILVVLLHCL